MRALIERTAPEPAPVVQPKETTTAKAEATPPASTHPATTIHVVRRGETLSSISQKYYGTRANWKLILDANSGVVKSAKDLKPNMKLVIPTTKAMTAKLASSQPAKATTTLSATTLAPSAAAPAHAGASAGAAVSSADGTPSL
jgi:LysM repeat protein